MIDSGCLQVKAEQTNDAKHPQKDWVSSLDAAQDEQGSQFIPPIIYASRTHSQLAQVIRELRATSYRCWGVPTLCWTHAFDWLRPACLAACGLRLQQRRDADRLAARTRCNCRLGRMTALACRPEEHAH